MHTREEGTPRVAGGWMGNPAMLDPTSSNALGAALLCSVSPLFLAATDMHAQLKRRHCAVRITRKSHGHTVTPTPASAGDSALLLFGLKIGKRSICCGL